MRCGWKIAGFTALLSLLAADVGLNVERAFSPTVTPSQPYLENTKDKGDPDDQWLGWERLIVRFSNDPQSIITFLLAGLTGVYVVIMGKQTGAIRQSAIAAESSADFIAVTERAYVFAKVQPDDPFDQPQGTGHLRCRMKVTFTNNGKTPAVMKMIRAYPVLGRSPPIELLATQRQHTVIPDGLVIGAGESYELRLQKTLRGDEWSDIGDGDAQLYCIGRLEYLDVLSRKQSIGFCWQLVLGDSASPRFAMATETPLNYFT